jgi:hypothetical protein
MGLPMARAVAADQPLDQSKIISVRPAVPDGAKAFVNQQNKLEQDRRKKPLFGNWFAKKPSQPAGYECQTAAPPPKASSGKTFWDIFNPAKWGKNTQKTDTNQQQVNQQQLQKTQQLQPGRTQQGGPEAPAWNQSAPGQAQPAYEQMPPPNITAPTSRPGWGG